MPVVLHHGDALLRTKNSNSPRHFGHHHHFQHGHYGGLQQDRAPESKNFSLTAGVSSVLAQLELSCGEEDYFRAFNLDITCPAHLPIVTSCNCLTKTAAGDLISKNKGLITYQGVCKCASIRARSTPAEHVITRSSCCSRSRIAEDHYHPHTAAVSAAQVVYCPPEAPYKTKYRSNTGLVRCGPDRMVSKCLCLGKTGSTRRVGQVVGGDCRCVSGSKRGRDEVARTVCCSKREEDETGEQVLQQIIQQP